MDKQSLHKGFMLAQLRVEPLAGQITAPDDSQYHVGPKAMDVLVCLAQRPGDTVERNTIFEEVWGNSARSDESLTHHVSELRHALKDNATRPQYLQTIPRRGYRLIAPVSSLAEAKPQLTATPQPEPEEGGFFSRQFSDLRKRKVFQIVVGYPVLAWLLLQIIDVVWEYLLQPLGAPVWLVPTLVVLMALGYPVAIFLAWAIDLTPDGLEVTKAENGSSLGLSLGILGTGSIAITAIALFVYFNAYQPPDNVVEEPELVAEADMIAEPAQSSIAVLRFLNIGDHPAGAYLSDGITEELIHELANLSSVKVASRTSVWPLLTSDLQATDIAARLKVDRILEGSVRSEGQLVRITAQLIDKDGFHLWSKAYDRKLDDVDILEIQKDISALVVNELDIPLDDKTKTRLSVQATKNSDAFDKYLQGRQFLRQPGTEESLTNAQTLFDAAIALDNRFSLAYAGLCETHLAWYRLTRATENFTQAEVSCHRALTLDGGLGEVYTALGNLYRHSGQTEKAYQEYMTALSINPSLEPAHYGLGRVFQAEGRLEEAEGALRKTVELEPGYWGTHLGFGNFLTRNGRHAEAAPYYVTATELAPDYAGGFINLGSSLYWLGNLEDAEAAWQRALELDSDAMAFRNMGTLHYYQHRFADAVDMHRQAVAIAPSDHRTWGRLAAAERYVAGQEDASQVSYRKAIELVNAQLAVNPDEAEDLSYLSAYLVNTGEPQAARTAAYRALELAPENPSTHYFAAIVEIRTGNVEDAISRLETAVDNGYSSNLIAADPQFASLVEQADFEALIARNTGVNALKSKQ